MRTGPKPRDVRDRLIENIEVGDGANPCWNWTGFFNQYGYGRLGFGKYGDPAIPYNHHKMAHRVSYELFVGPVPDGLQLDHLCRNRGCVNPAHLEAVTCQENLRRGEQQQRTHCIRGHPLSGENLYISKAKMRSCKVCRRAAMRAWTARRKAAA